MDIKNIKIFGKDALSKLKKSIALMSAGVVMMTFSGCGKDEYIEHENSSTYTYSNEDDEVREYWAGIRDSDIERLPDSIKYFSLSHCTFVTNLDCLPDVCPNIKRLNLNSCSGITDLSFIYSLKKLTHVTLNDMVGITPELIDYLEKNEIKYSVTSDDIEASDKTDQILSEIITDGMTDDEKIAAIVTYVSKNCKYRFSKAEESNENPLTSTLLDKKGVCYGYAYTTNVLLRKAGVESFQLCDTNHSWNLVDQDGKYYYIDVTNLGGGRDISFIAWPLIEHTGFSPNYMVDPKATVLTPMSDYDDRNSIVIPQSLVDDIEKGEEEKSLIEKYGNTIPTCIIEFLIVIVGINMGIDKAKEAIKNSRKK